MFSNTKPIKRYAYVFKNYQIHPDDAEVYCSTKPPYEHIKVFFTEGSFNTSGYCYLYDEFEEFPLKRIYKSECTFENDYYMGFPVEFKSETIAALKPIVDLENLTVEDGLIEI